ncbi:uncharacterized protein LOC114916074 [Cajanus cajan]|uniref:uncharacterized protein LOC114916074 n=1 Tax=Cajanus cajan TaxID=3821 RepID=UPI0010FB6D60|nr:uncharacterized protein LOC114916074 [Cajanus cajan]
MMNLVGGRKNKISKQKTKKKMVSMSWKEKKELAEKKEEVLRKDIDDLKTWIDVIETMNDQQLKEYLENHAGELKSRKGQKIKNKVQSTSKLKSSSSSNVIMASVWKFHKK